MLVFKWQETTKLTSGRVWWFHFGFGKSTLHIHPKQKKGFLKTYISLHSTPGRLYAEFDKVDMAESCSLSGSQMCFSPAAQMQCTYVRGIQTNPALTHTCWGEKVKQWISNHKNRTFYAAVVDKESHE